MLNFNIIFNELPFCLKMAAKSRECRLCPISMKIDILGWFRVANMMVQLIIFFKAAILFKMAAISGECQLCSDFNENWYLGVIWCAEYDGAIKFVFLPYCAYDVILLCFVSQVSDSGSWEPLVHLSWGQ